MSGSYLEDSLRRLGFADAAEDTQSMQRLDRKMSPAVKQVCPLHVLFTAARLTLPVWVHVQAISDIAAPAGSMQSASG